MANNFFVKLEFHFECHCVIAIINTRNHENTSPVLCCARHVSISDLGHYGQYEYTLKLGVLCDLYRRGFGGVYGV